MSLPHALLTTLIERPGTGSDLARRFDSSIAYFWPASHQQIYRELARLKEAGWVESTPDATHGRRRHYVCLPAGRAELERWVAEGGQAPLIRDPLLVRLRADAALGDLDLEPQLRARLAEHESRLTAYRAIDVRDFAGELDRRGRLQQAILLAGISFEEHSIEWCRQALRVLTDEPT